MAARGHVAGCQMLWSRSSTPTRKHKRRRFKGIEHQRQFCKVCHRRGSVPAAGTVQQGVAWVTGLFSPGSAAQAQKLEPSGPH